MFQFPLVLILIIFISDFYNINLSANLKVKSILPEVQPYMLMFNSANNSLFPHLMRTVESSQTTGSSMNSVVEMFRRTRFLCSKVSGQLIPQDLQNGHSDQIIHHYSTPFCLTRCLSVYNPTFIKLIDLDKKIITSRVIGQCSVTKMKTICVFI